MYTYTGTVCTKCGQPHTIPTVWMGVTPPPLYCGCVKSNTITTNITK